MIKVYVIPLEKLGDRSFNEMAVSDLQIEGKGYTLAEFQDQFNKSRFDCTTQFIKFVSI